MDVIILDMGNEVKGESSATGYENKIDLLGFSHGVAMQITGDISNSERTSGRPNHQDFTVTKYLDASSPVLNQACCEGKLFPKAEVIIARNDSGKVIELMRYVMSNVLISSVSIGGGGGDKPVETLTLNYNKITWSFTHQKLEGSHAKVIERKWDVAQNAAK